MTMPLADAFDLVAHTEFLEQRLAATVEELAHRPGLTEEKSWLETARRHVARAREGTFDLLTRALRLSELAPLRAERARALQGAAVDAVEHLQVAIATVAGERSPLLEVIYRNLKLPAMRRCNREDFEKFCLEIEKRLASSYAKRMLADPSLAVLEPSLQQVRRAFAEWRGIFATASDDESQVLRDELEAAARRVELPCRQARFLAEAALLAAEDLRESSGIFEKPKRRAARLTRTDPETGSSTPDASETSEAEAKTPSPSETASDDQDDER